MTSIDLITVAVGAITQVIVTLRKGKGVEASVGKQVAEARDYLAQAVIVHGVKIDELIKADLRSQQEIQDLSIKVVAVRSSMQEQTEAVHKLSGRIDQLARGGSGQGAPTGSSPAGTPVGSDGPQNFGKVIVKP